MSLLPTYTAGGNAWRLAPRCPLCTLDILFGQRVFICETEARGEFVVHKACMVPRLGEAPTEHDRRVQELQR